MPASDRAIVRRSSISRSITRVSSRIGVRCAASGRVDAVDDGLEVAGDHGERRAQLVAHVGQQRPPLLLVGLETRGHRVEPVGELLDRGQVGSRLPDPDAVVAFLHAPGRRQHRVEVAGGAGHAARERRDDPDRAEDRDDHRDRSEMRQERADRGDDRGDDDEEEDEEDAAEALAPAPRPAAPGIPAHEPRSTAERTGVLVVGIQAALARPGLPGLAASLIRAPAGPARWPAGPVRGPAGRSAATGRRDRGRAARRRSMRPGRPAGLLGHGVARRSSANR